MGHVEKLRSLQGRIKEFKMKYLVGAGIGGLFGLGVPMMMHAQKVDSDDMSRIEEFQPVEDMQPILPSHSTQHLLDDMCRYLELQSEEPKEQAKECLEVEIPAVPAI